VVICGELSDAFKLVSQNKEICAPIS